MGLVLFIFISESVEIGIRLLFSLTIDQTLGISREEIKAFFTYHSAALTWCSAALGSVELVFHQLQVILIRGGTLMRTTWSTHSSLIVLNDMSLCI